LNLAVARHREISVTMMMGINQRGKPVICKRDPALQEYWGNAMQMMLKASPLHSLLEEIVYPTSSVARDLILAKIPSRSLMCAGFRRAAELVFGVLGEV
jgi:hypothetical protein